MASVAGLSVQAPLSSHWFITLGGDAECEDQEATCLGSNQITVDPVDRYPYMADREGWAPSNTQWSFLWTLLGT